MLFFVEWCQSDWFRNWEWLFRFWAEARKRRGGAKRRPTRARGARRKPVRASVDERARAHSEVQPSRLRLVFLFFIAKHWDLKTIPYHVRSNPSKITDFHVNFALKREIKKISVTSLHKNLHSINSCVYAWVQPTVFYILSRFEA